MAIKELHNEIKEDEQLGISDPLNTSQDATLAQTEAPPGSFSNISSQEEIIQNGMLRSGNFVAATTGWQIKADGNVEFNSGTFRSQLIAGSIDIPDTTTANSFHVNSDGDAWWGATTLATGVAWVKKDGSVKFTSGTIGGWTLAATTLTASNIVIDSGNQKITVGDIAGGTEITLDGSTGKISSNGAVWSLDGAGVLVGFGNKVNRSITNVDTHSTNTEQTLMSVSIPANTLGTTNVIQFKMFISDFDHVDNQTETIRFKYGATTIASITISDTSGGNKANMQGFIEGYLFAAGATNSQEGSISFNFGTGIIYNSIEDSLNVIGASSGTAAEDSTGALNLVVTEQNSVSNVASGLVMAHYVVTKIT